MSLALTERLFHRAVFRQGNGACRVVGGWMLATSGAVLGIIIVGGLTRLTESGLSMTDWKLIHFFPPKNEADWNDYFDLYKKTPEYRMNNSGMSVEEYKKIYWWEHAHRVYGRLLGLAVIIPSAFFIIRPGWATKKVKRVMAICSGLVVFQGLLGWHMVKSGLDEDNVKRQQAARVSAYRLAAHLGSAVALFSTLFYSGLSIVSTPVKFDNNALKHQIRRATHSVSGLILATMLTGAFVAGLDAGMIYNTFPKMGDQWIPSDIWNNKNGYKNLTENPTTVQFVHRLMAIGTVCTIASFYAWTSKYKGSLPKRVRLALNALILTSLGQGLVGIATLTYGVPVALGSAHQTGAMITLSTSLYLMNIMRPIP